MRIATWNVNSIKAREERLLRWLAANDPDVLCLQELKCLDEQMPFAAIEQAGWRTVASCQKTYNGVAILSKLEATDVVRGLGDDEEDTQARLIAATVGGVRVASAYFPNGGVVGTDKWTYKLGWMKRLAGWLERNVARESRFALCGDFNVATDDLDVQNPNEWAESVLYHPEARRALEQVRAFGLVDVFRKHHPEGRIYTWWDYRQLSFPKNDGLRIDYVYATPALADRSRAAHADRPERKGKQPSDHIPVVVDFET